MTTLQEYTWKIVVGKGIYKIETQAHYLSINNEGWEEEAPMLKIKKIKFSTLQTHGSVICGAIGCL